MKFNINRKTFYSSLLIVSKPISSLSPIEALSGILIDAKEDKITFTGSDSTTSVQSTIYADDKNVLRIDEPGRVILESKYLLEIIKKLDSEQVELLVDSNNTACIKSKNGKFNLVGIRASEYPEIDFKKPDISFELNSNIVKTTIKQTIFACSDKDETRPILTGVNFHAENGNLYCSATDSYRLVRKTIDLASPLTFDVVVSKKSLNELLHILPDDQAVQINVNDKKIQFVTKEAMFQTNLIAGTYPNVQRIIPSNFVSSLKADSKTLASAVDRTNFIKTDKVHLVKFECDSNQTALKTFSAEIGYTNEILENCSYQGENLNLTLNGTYVLDAIKALDGKETMFEFGGQLKSLKVSSPDDDSILMVLIPVRDYN